MAEAPKVRIEEQRRQAETKDKAAKEKRKQGTKSATKQAIALKLDCNESAQATGSEFCRITGTSWNLSGNPFLKACHSDPALAGEESLVFPAVSRTTETLPLRGLRASAHGAQGDNR